MCLFAPSSFPPALLSGHVRRRPRARERTRTSLRAADSISKVLKRWHTYIHTRALAQIHTVVCGWDGVMMMMTMFIQLCVSVIHGITHSTMIKWCVCALASVCLFDYFCYCYRRWCCSACSIKKCVFLPFNIQHKMHVAYNCVCGW